MIRNNQKMEGKPFSLLLLKINDEKLWQAYKEEQRNHIRDNLFILCYFSICLGLLTTLYYLIFGADLHTMPWIWELIAVITSLALLVLFKHLCEEVLDIAGFLLCVTQMIRVLLVIKQAITHNVDSNDRFDFYVTAQLTVYEFGKIFLQDLLFAAKF